MDPIRHDMHTITERLGTIQSDFRREHSTHRPVNVINITAHGTLYVNICAPCREITIIRVGFDKSLIKAMRGDKDGI